MPDSKQKLDRRVVLAGAGGVGALALAAAVLPAGNAPGAVPAAAATKPLPDTAAGYRLTEHVQRYYKTARV